VRCFVVSLSIKLITLSFQWRVDLPLANHFPLSKGCVAITIPLSVEERDDYFVVCKSPVLTCYMRVYSD
jgi:hypothetical protein